MDKIDQYNKLIEDIVYDYVKRLHEEEKAGEIPNKDDYRIMFYQGIVHQLNLWDRYFGFDDILLCEKHKFPAISVIDFYDYCLEKYYNKEEIGTNYYNFARKSLNPDKYKQEEKQDLKTCEENVKKAKLELEKAILEHNKNGGVQVEK